MEELRKRFFDTLAEKGFKEMGQNDYGQKVFNTELKPEHANMSDGYDIKYILTYHSTFGIRFDIDKYSIGGFTGNQQFTERLFSGHIETIDDLEKILELTSFTRFM